MNSNSGKSLNSKKEIVSALAFFLTSLSRSISNYKYVSLTERRFFNLFYTVILRDDCLHMNDKIIGKLVSNTGLLLQHGALLEYYLKEGRFPAILIADDLTIHGRSIGKFLYQLEKAIIADYEKKHGTPLSKNEAAVLHYQLVKAIDIRVFARSRNPLLLEDGYAAKLKCNYKLYGDQLHSVTDLLSQTVNSPKVANTSFVLSASFHPENGDAANSGRDPLKEIKADRRSWKRIFWISREGRSAKKLHAYIYPRMDENGVYLISTVRFYENRTPLLTSYPLFSFLEADDSGGRCGFERIYRSLRDVLSRNGDCYNPLCTILEDRNLYVRQVRGQLVGTFLSIADLMEFCADYDLSATEIFQKTDVQKLSINYGHKTLSAFRQLLENSELCSTLAEIIREGLRANTERLPFEDERKELLSLYKQSDSSKDCLLALFGAEGSVPKGFAEKQFQHLKDQVELLSECESEYGHGERCHFERLQDMSDRMIILTADPVSVQNMTKWEPVSKAALSGDFADIDPKELDRCKVIDYINDKLEQAVYELGMCSEKSAYCFFNAPFLYRADRFDGWWDTDQEDSCGVISFTQYMGLRKEYLPASGYGRVAAYLALADKGRIAGKIQYMEDDSAVYAICKAGERAMFYLPQKFSVFVPALCMVEKNSLLLNLPPLEAVRQFVKKHLTYEGPCKDVIARLFDLRIFIDKYLKILGEAGQLFAGWNFSTLIAQEDPLHETAQKEFLIQAQKFLKK